MALDQEAENIIVPGQGLRRVVPLSLVSAIGFSGMYLVLSTYLHLHRPCVENYFLMELERDLRCKSVQSVELKKALFITI